jgi:hypothetical protein
MARRPRLLGSIVCVVVGTSLGAAVVVSTPACTVFDGIVFDGGTAGATSSSSSSTGTGGSTGLHYLSPEDGARLCSRLAECPEPELLESVVDSTGIPLDQTNYSLCMTWATGPIPNDRIGFAYQQKTLECIVKAANCGAATACNSNEFFAGDDPRCAGKLDLPADAGGEFCQDENTVIRCDTGGDALHCDNPYYSKSKCLEDKDGSRWCATKTNCTVGSQCVGSVTQFCGQNSILEFAVDCSTVGLTCGTDAKSGITDCLTDSVADYCLDGMTPPAPPLVCDGATVKQCNATYYSPFHCDALGGTCQLTDGQAICRRKDDVCTPFDATVNKCDGSIAKLCVGGQLTDFDCKSIGKSCAVSPAFGCH